jgi:uncharacterized protein with HEPN domain
MMLNDDDLVRLRHMRDYARETVEFSDGVSQAELNRDVKLQRALTYTTGIIGEAAAHLSDEFREAHPEMPWHDIVGMRNVLFHEYFRIDQQLLWNTITYSVPELLVFLEDVLPD